MPLERITPGEAACEVDAQGAAQSAVQCLGLAQAEFRRFGRVVFGMVMATALEIADQTGPAPIVSARVPFAIEA